MERAATPIVSAIVPARDEERNIATCVESLARQEPVGEIIVVNDQSGDGTGKILREISLRMPRLRVIQVESLPPGWVGKNYALSRGAAEARGEWLLFSDADAVHLPDSTEKALEIAQKESAALVSFSPEQETGTWWERALIPFVFTRLAVRFRYGAINDPDSPAAAANGQYLLIRRDAYDAIGGHGAVSGEVLEDVALARRVKQAGMHIYFGPGAGIVRTRMYDRLGAMWEGWEKNLYPLMGGSPGSVAREVVTVFPIIPATMMVLGVLHWVFLVAGLGLLLGRHAAYAGTLKSNRMPLRNIQFYVPAVILYSGALLASWWRYSRGSVVWKGRRYAVGSAEKTRTPVSGDANWSA